jgi:hypothetical protein
MKKLKSYQLHPVRFAPWGCPFPLKEKEQAEVGQRPTFLAPCYRRGGWKYTPGILLLAKVLLKPQNGILSRIPIKSYRL